MLGFIVRRGLQAIAVMVAVAAVSFVIFRFVGDPVNNMVGQEASVEQRQQIRADLGLDDPIAVQFVRFVGDALTGDFGVSLRLKRPVEDLIAERLPATLELVFVSAVFALSLGILLGVFTGIRRESWISKAILTVSLIGVSLPTFVIGIGLIYAFAVEGKILPAFGRGETVAIGWWTTGFLTWEGLRALILPSITLGLFQMTLILRLVRAEMLEVLRADYIKFARARGLPERTINLGHALKNTLVPVITIAGINIGTLIAFSIITETVFQWPGMGLLFIQGVLFADIPIMAAYLVLAALVFVVINLVVDILYYAVDPRLSVDTGKT